MVVYWQQRNVQQSLMHAQSYCFPLLSNCFFDVLQGLLSLSYRLLCVHLTRNKITKYVAPWSLDIPWWKPACSSEYPQKCRNQIALQRRCSEYATQAYLTNCAWSHTAPTVGYETWILNHASCFTRATLIETGVYDKFSFLLRASLTASSSFKDSVSFRLLLSRERNNILLEQNTCFWVYFRIISWLLFLHLGFVFPYFISLLVYLFFTIYI